MQKTGKALLQLINSDSSIERIRKPEKTSHDDLVTAHLALVCIHLRFLLAGLFFLTSHE